MPYNPRARSDRPAGSSDSTPRTGGGAGRPPRRDGEGGEKRSYGGGAGAGRPPRRDGEGPTRRAAHGEGWVRPEGRSENPRRSAEGTRTPGERGSYNTGPRPDRRDDRPGGRGGDRPRPTGGPRGSDRDSSRDSRGGPRGSDRDSSRDSRGGRFDRTAPRRVERPMTAADKRAAEVRERRGPKPEKVEVQPPPWVRDQWVDEGSMRSAAEQATDRATMAAPEARRRKSGELAPEVADDLQRAAPAARQARYQERLSSAADALDRGRFDDARRMVQPVLRDLPDMAFAHEIAGLALYRTGQWRKAAAELEVARQLDGTLNHHAVLADCYRGLRRFGDVEKLWDELKAGSPSPALMAEGRIVAAGALADQGDLPGAIRLLGRSEAVPKKLRDYHLRQWYAVADLYDRSGDIIKARRYFGLVAQADADFADVVDRLRSLGR